MGQTKLRDEQMGFNTSTGHDHDGSDSKKIVYTNITDAPSFETSASNIKADGTASAGNSGKIADAAHVHPQEVIPISRGGTGETTDVNLFQNKGINIINFDTTFNYNYVASISASTLGTLPDGVWVIIVNYFANPFILQIAHEMHASTVTYDTGRTWVREKYNESQYVWSTWKLL